MIHVASIIVFFFFFDFLCTETTIKQYRVLLFFLADFTTFVFACGAERERERERERELFVSVSN